MDNISPSSKYISLSSAKVNITLRINQVSTALLFEQSKEAVTYFPFTFCLPAVLNQMERIKTITKGRQWFPSDCLPQPGSSVKVTKVICINSLPCHLISCPCWVSGNKSHGSVFHIVTIRTESNCTQLSQITLDSYWDLGGAACYWFRKYSLEWSIICPRNVEIKLILWRVLMNYFLRVGDCTLPVECSSCTLIQGNDVVASYIGTQSAV